MKRRVYAWIAAAMLWVAILTPCEASAINLRSPEDTAKFFINDLFGGEWFSAARKCLDETKLRAWAPPVLTRYIVYPSVKDITVLETRIDGDRAWVTLDMTAVDVRNDEFYTLLFNYDFSNCDPYCADYSVADLAGLLYYQDMSVVFKEEYRKHFTVPVALRYDQEEWMIDFDETLLAWRGDRACDIRAESCGMLEFDPFMMRYYDWNVQRPRNTEYYEWLMGVTPDELFALRGEPCWNLWLRLTSGAPEEGARDFEMTGGVCAPEPEAFPGESDLMIAGEIYGQHWAEYDGAWHAVMRAYVPEYDGGALPEGMSLKFKRRLDIDSPMYSEEILEVQLGGTPCKPPVPEGAVRIQMDCYERIQDVHIEENSGFNRFVMDTIGKAARGGLGDKAFGWANLPDGVLDLPVGSDEYALYMLSGHMEKDAGFFGVYGMICSVSDGAYTPLYTGCGMCGAPNDHWDGRECGYRDTKTAPFRIPVIIPVNGRTDDELNEAVRALTLTATFSGESRHYLDEHGKIAYVGPRVTLPVDLSGMTLWEGEDMPKVPYEYHWEAPSEDDEYQYDGWTEDERGIG